MKTQYLKFFISALIVAAIISAFISSCKNNNLNPIIKKAAPSITSIAPSHALPNTVISIIGVNFNTMLANNSVIINGISAVIDSVSATEIKVTVPANATTGKISLVTGGITVTSPSNFTVDGDVTVIKSIVPGFALPNSEISIIGSNFSTMLANNSVTINGVVAVVDSASATEIVVTVPANATTGKVTLVTGGAILTSPSNFTVASTIIDLGPDNSHYVYLEHIASTISSNDYYGDNGSDTVYKTQLRTTTILAVINNPGGNTLWGTAMDTTGNVYETGQTTSVIYKITPAGEVSILAGNGTAGHADGQGTAAQFSHPMGLAIDAKGNLYTNDNHFIRKITPAGLVSTIAGNGTTGYKDGPSNTAEFGNIEGITVDAKGNVYVSDNKYFNIRKISAGSVTTLAGSGTSGNVDGQGTAAQFLYPQAMAADAAGNIFVSDNTPLDFSVQNVRRITQTGLVSTFLRGHFHFPDGITFTRNGAMLVCNTLNGYNGGYVSCVLFGN